MNRLLSALALSPACKAITSISKNEYVIVAEHWTPDHLYYSIHVVDVKEGITPFATASTLKGWNAMEMWIKNIEKWAGVSIDVYDNRWQPLEKAFG